MSYRIPLGALERLSGHEHYPITAGEENPRWDLDERVVRSAEACSLCKAIAEAFDEGYDQALNDLPSSLVI